MDPEGVVHRDKPLRLGVGVLGERWWQLGLPGQNWGEVTPPSEKGVKMFELAQLNLFTPKVRKGGASHWQFTSMCLQALGLGGMKFAGRVWTWTPTWSAIMEMGGFAPSAANRGAYAGLVHGIAYRPKPKQAQGPRNPRKCAPPPPPAAAPPQPPGRLRQGRGSHHPRP